ncbi:20868_t:CDS:2, partial [Gigaspora margarita]
AYKCQKPVVGGTASRAQWVGIVPLNYNTQISNKTKSKANWFVVDAVYGGYKQNAFGAKRYQGFIKTP